MSTIIETIAKELTYKPKERLGYMRSLSLPHQSAVFEYLSPHVQQNLLTQLRTIELVDIIDHMDIRQAEKVLSRIRNEKKRLRIISKIKTETKEKLEYFLRFHPKATLSLVSFNYVYLADTLTVGEAADAIEEHYRDTDKFPEVLVHHNGELVGEVPMTTLVRERNSTKLAKYIKPVHTITYREDVAEIINTLSEAHKQKVIVLDADDSVLGIIYADDAIALFGHLPAESLYNTSGVDDAEQPFDTTYQKFHRRYRWLILNLMTAFLAGSMVFLYQDTINAMAVLAMYIPIVAGMGGNAASQAFAVMLRGITLGTIKWQDAKPALLHELNAGFLNGLVIGGIVALISVVWNGSWTLGLVVGASMIGVHMLASVTGALVPLLAKHLGFDPASVSSIVITTVTDVGGLFLMLGLATLFLM